MAESVNCILVVPMRVSYDSFGLPPIHLFLAPFILHYVTLQEEGGSPRIIHVCCGPADEYQRTLAHLVSLL